MENMNGSPRSASTKPVLPLSGGCFCGTVRYRIDAFPLLLYACHCTQCQRQTGSAFGMSMPVATNSFHIVKGKPKAWQRPTASGDAVVTSWFCDNCGGRIYGERNTRPDSVNVRAGTLDDTTWLIPAAHFFMGNAQPWETVGETSICFETIPGPDDFREAAERWRQFWTT
jgi:hypothetical protein